MLKQVQMTRSAGYRLQGLGSREENWQSVQGFNATEKVVRAVCGSPSLCHPGLDPGSALLKAWLGVAGWGLEEQVISSMLQVVSCESKGRGQRFEDRCRKIKSDRSAVEWFSVHRMKNLFFVPERGSVFVLGQAIKQEHPDSDQELCRNDGIWSFRNNH